MELSHAILEEVFQVTRQVDRGDITLTKGRDDPVRAYVQRQLGKHDHSLTAPHV